MFQSSFIQKTAASILIAVMAFVVAFHLLILFGVIDFKIVWGGRLNSIGEMVVFELVSIVSNTLFLLVVLRKTGKLRFIPNEKVINGVLWVMAAVFLLNTVGNMLSRNYWEMIVFTPVTFVLTVCCVILAMEKERKARNVSRQTSTN
jgi:hypothetical protein